MRIWIKNRCKVNSSNGYSLLELMVVIVILSILVTVSIPLIFNSINKTKQETIRINCLQIERMYETYLIIEILQHSDFIFTQYLNEYSYSKGIDDYQITYADGEVQCNYNEIDNESDETEEDEVPFL